MKKSVLALFLFPIAALAAKPHEAKNFSFRCTSQMPTTSFYMEQKESEMVLTVLHHNGVGYMPIHEGIVVPNDLNYLAAKAKVLTRLGRQTEFRFPVSRCKKFGDGVMSCAGGDRKNIDGLDVEALNLVTSIYTRRVFDEKIDYYGVALSLNVAGSPPVSEISMQYSTDECKFD